jgi:nitrogenase-stabilizing/protective protein
VSVVDDLRRLSAAEDIFAYLDVPYEKRVLDVARLHILRRMGDTLARAASEASDVHEAATRARYKAHLEAAYADFVARSPLDERVFKVLKDAVRDRSVGKPRAFVPLADLGGGDPSLAARGTSKER